jgi:DNA-binding NtrC family response regulator
VTLDPSIRVLVVDDEEPFRRLLERNLARSGATVVGAGSGEQALERARELDFDVALLDIAMPGISGIELLSRLRADHPALEAIVMTGHGTIESAIEAMKLGAYDYLEKPLKMSELGLLIERALEKRRLATENRTLRDELRRREPPAEIAGESTPVLEVLALIERYAAAPAPVLVLGESGTGKELAARAIHRRGPRAERPFIAINCGALQETLLENELFGHVRGAFTGAVSERRGLFEVADKGTLFIDEVCEMSPGIQKKFLRVLELGEFRRLGETAVRKVDVRIVAATNREIEREVHEGRFREDLFYRLNVLQVRMPALRERRADVPVLVRHFLERHRRPDGARASVAPAALERLVRYDWPGNVRELFNVLERAVIVARGHEIGLPDLPDLTPRGPLAPPPGNGSGAPARAAAHPGEEAASSTLDELERRHVMRVLEACGGNKTRAAIELGISLRSLYRKLEKFARPAGEPHAPLGEVP